MPDIVRHCPGVTRYLASENLQDHKVNRRKDGERKRMGKEHNEFILTALEAFQPVIHPTVMSEDWWKSITAPPQAKLPPF